MTKYIVFLAGALALTACSSPEPSVSASGTEAASAYPSAVYPSTSGSSDNSGESGGSDNR